MSSGFLFFVSGVVTFLLFCCSWSAYYSPPCFYSHFGEPFVALCGLGSEGEVDAASYRSASFRAQPDTQSSGRGVSCNIGRNLLPQAATP